MFSLFIDYLFLALCIKGKNRYSMEEYIDQIEKFLRGQMSKEEEDVFKTSMTTDAQQRLFAFIVASILKKQKSW